jgi:ABC-type lipoprotein release transport system permease subunit
MKRRVPGRTSLVWQVALRFLFGRRNDPGSRNYTFRRIRGGVLGIALSLIPLVVVFVVANGMIRRHYRPVPGNRNLSSSTGCPGR